MPSSADSTLPRPTVALWRGMRRKCPKCGGGRLFRGWFTMLDACPTCGRPFVSEEGFFLGAFVVNLGVTQLALVAFIAVGFALTVPDPPAVTLALLAAAVTLVVPVVFYPFSKTIWAAFELIMKRR